MRNLLIGLIIAMAFLAFGCSNPELERAQSRSKVTLTGEFLTENPDVINFPIRIVLAIDCSGSMGYSDTTGHRIQAAWDFIQTYHDYESVKFNVILWNYQPRSTGFTRDLDQIWAFLQTANNTSVTDYIGTIENATSSFLQEISLMEGDDAQSANITRMKCIVLFFSDGLPTTGDDPEDMQDEGDIIEAVQNMEDELYDRGVPRLTFHTFFLSNLFYTDGVPDSDYPAAVNLLTRMANTGNGIFTEFFDATSVDFINIVDMRLTVEYKVKFIIAFNANVRPGNEIVYVDSDGDGLTDEEELDVDFNHNGRIDPDEEGRATDPTRRDTDNDGLSDYFERKMSTIDDALDPLNPNDSGCPHGAETFDRDRDGLTDCEEDIKGTSVFNPDSDSDGIPDGIEFAMGTNPHEKQDMTDSDFDGVPDWLEVQRHSNVLINDDKIRKRYSYYYDIRDLGLIELNQGTVYETRRRNFSFNISNIDIMPTQESDRLARGENLIRFFIAEVPEDMPETNPVYRVADIVVDFFDTKSRVIPVDSFEAL